MREKVNFLLEKYNISKRDAIILIVVAGFLILAGMFVSLAISVSVSKTSGHAFCSSCHSMKPMVEAYLESPHGGKNRVGVRATCVECHLPHNGVISYLYVKAKLGINDFFVETFIDTDKIDWRKTSKNREHFVYDSGCLNCHKNLIDATSHQPKAVIAHKSYFNDKKDKCVTCHYDIGHKNLYDYIDKHQKNVSKNN